MAGQRRVSERMRKAQSSYQRSKKNKGKASGPLIISGLGTVRAGSSSHEAGLAQLAKTRSSMEASRPKGLSGLKQRVSKARAKVAAKVNQGKLAVKTRLKKIGANVKATKSSVTAKLKAVGRNATPALPPARLPLASIAKPSFKTGIAKARMASAVKMPMAMPKR